MKKHVTVVGAIHIGFGILGLIGAVAVFFALNFAKGFVENEEMPTMVLEFPVNQSSDCLSGLCQHSDWLEE